MVYAALFVGGALGAMLRLAAGEILPYGAWTTMGINWLGCLVLGFFLPYTAVKGKLPEAVRIGISAGVLGGFTTFSTFSVETLAFVQQERWWSALLYVGGSLLGGIALAGCGWLAARRTVRA
ncbi:hypothetical protein CIG75_17740 [Tumebacillus algifaecis]|uniref:Fluoride-specific ion channel FluC n=1 Tax=Tumebacillus algifaecis TaxID=1214604 RepID=A0A223D561_9BACL|nr:CrcB family protein [Tumebacillus algifaecis]ASS76627.1 hypothetical protein CIG75_17740 [Tumebacillus algifaecis]